MKYNIEVQTVEVSAEKFFSIMLYMSEEEYEQVKLDTKAFGDSIVQAVETADGS